MSTTESAASLPSASSTTSSCAASVEDDELDVIRADAMRDNLRGMEAELVDLVLETSSAWQWMDWLRVPLECATATGSLRVVKHLLSIGVETGSPPRRSRPRPLLHAAASNGNAEIVEELVKAGADVHEVDRNHNDRTALHCAAASGADAAVRALSSAGAFVDTADTRGWTPLHLAAKMGHRGVVVFLLLKGANALGATVPEGDSPLHLAANNNHAGVIEDMLALGNACVGCCNAHGQTALHLAARNCRFEACIALLRAGAAIGRVSSQGLSCLDIAAWNGHTGRLLQILTAAEPTNDRKRRCGLALYYAAKANKPNTIRDLVSLGANVDQRRSGGLTSLHHTAGRGASEATEALLQAGADIEGRNYQGHTPLHRACIFSKSRTVSLLLRWGAKESATTFDNASASDLVGTAENVPPDEMDNKQVEDAVILYMLERAPADRLWRRRSWLVLCRARWLARISEKQSSRPPAPPPPPPPPLPKACPAPHPPDGPNKKPRATGSGNAALSRGRNEGASCYAGGGVAPRCEGHGRRLKETERTVLRLGRESVLSDGGGGAGRGGRGGGGTGFVGAVERLLLLREEGVFREVVTFL